MRFWQKDNQEPWAITEPALTTILDISARDNEKPEIVAANLARDVDHVGSVEGGDGVVVISVTGPLFRYMNFFSMLFGGSTYELITKEIKSALNDKSVRAIVLVFDSPGGEVNGCSELAQLIFNARGIKPIVAYASGDCASGAYWIASACDRIVVADTATLGSVGVVAMLNGKGKDDTTLEFVSSQSPHKRLDINADEGKQRMQKRVDSLAQVFIDRIAEHRGVDSSVVENDYGKGDVFIGKQAIEAGLADQQGTLDSVLSELSVNHHEDEHIEPEFNSIEKNSLEIFMTLEELCAAHPALTSQLIAQGETTARERIADILSCDSSAEQFTVAKHLALNTTLAADVVKQTLSVMPKLEPTKKTEVVQPPKTPNTDFTSFMSTVDNPTIVPVGDEAETGETEETVAARIAGMSF